MASPKQRRSLWLPIEHRDVDGIPRTVVVHDGEHRLLLLSRIDPSVGGYTPYYAVARLPDEYVPSDGDWAELSKKARKWLGEIDVASVTFDAKRHAVRAHALRAYLRDP